MNQLNRNAFHREWKSVLFFLGAALAPTLWVLLKPRTVLQGTIGTILATTLIGLVAWWFLRREGARAGDIGFGWRSWRASVPLFLAWWAAASLVDLAAGAAAGLFGAQLQPIENIAWTPERVLGMARAWIFVGFAEELAFRGYLHNKLAALIDKRWAALLLSALLFGLWHLPGDIAQAGTVTGGMLVSVLLFTTISLLLFNLPYEWTGLLPFLALVHGWNDDLVMMTLRAPNAVGLAAGYLLVFVFLWLYARFWRKPAQEEAQLERLRKVTGGQPG